MPPFSVPVVMLSALSVELDCKAVSAFAPCATTAATDYATAAQGAKADTALQSNSTLNADNMTTGTLNGGTY